MPALIKTGDQQKGQPQGVAPTTKCPTDDLLGSEALLGPLIQIYTEGLLGSEALLGSLVQIYTDDLLGSEALLGPLIQIYTEGLLGSEALLGSLVQIYTDDLLGIQALLGLWFRYIQRKSIRTVGAGPCACPNKNGRSTKRATTGVALTDDLLVSEALLGPLVQIYTTKINPHRRGRPLCLP